jgi:hypothetical protein
MQYEHDTVIKSTGLVGLEVLRAIVMMSFVL